MNGVILVVVLLTLCGCGDTYNTTAPIVSANKLEITSSYFTIYSTTSPAVTVNGVVTQYNRFYKAQGFFGYNGDPQGAVLTMSGTSATYHPALTLASGKQVFFSLDVQKSDIQQLYGNQTFWCTLTDSHGIDSNTFPLTLAQ